MVRLEALRRGVLVYGAGSFGTFIHRSLVDAGIPVLGTIDDAPSTRSREGTLTSREAAGQYPGTIVCLGIYNPAADVFAISRNLSSCGFEEILSPVDIFRVLKEARVESPDRYWLTADESVYASHAERAKALREQLADTRSKDLLASIVDFRASGDLALSPVPDPLDHQYAPQDVPFLTNKMRLVDLGAYTGDTISNLTSAGADLESVIALEPDPANYRSLSRVLSELPATETLALPLGVTDDLRQISFLADGSAASHESPDGDLTIQCISLDLLLANWRPPHIKADIEGAELAALLGMTRILRSHRPHLAISVYHRPSDLFDIPEFLSNLDLDYQFHLRTYGYQTFDTILYAKPR